MKRISIISLQSVLVSLLLSSVFACGTRGRAVPDNMIPEERSSVAVLGEADVIDVRIFGESELSGTHQVGSGGTITMPLIGSIAISGLTLEQVAGKISSEYEKNYLMRAEVSVLVKEFNSRKIFVLGQVNRPGPISFAQNMTIIAAIAGAGGTAATASPNSTVITRNQNGKKERLIARVGDIGKGRASDIKLRPGDIIFVPESLF